MCKALDKEYGLLRCDSKVRQVADRATITIHEITRNFTKSARQLSAYSCSSWIVRLHASDARNIAGLFDVYQSVS